MDIARPDTKNYRVRDLATMIACVLLFDRCKLVSQLLVARCNRSDRAQNTSSLTHARTHPAQFTHSLARDQHAIATTDRLARSLTRSPARDVCTTVDRAAAMLGALSPAAQQQPPHAPIRPALDEQCDHGAAERDDGYGHESGNTQRTEHARSTDLPPPLDDDDDDDDDCECRCVFGAHRRVSGRAVARSARR